MKYTVAAYYDTELEKFFPPFLAPQTPEDVAEGIIDAAKKGKIEDCGHKQVFLLGDFETSTAEFGLVGKPKLLVDLTIFKVDA